MSFYYIISNALLICPVSSSALWSSLKINKSIRKWLTSILLYGNTTCTQNPFSLAGIYNFSDQHYVQHLAEFINIKISLFRNPTFHLPQSNSIENLTKLHNGNLGTIRNGCRYFRNLTIIRPLNICSFPQRVEQLSKNVCINLYNIPNDIDAKPPVYHISNPSNRK